jgi:AhpD family alkylhydroperoxidase
MTAPADPISFPIHTIDTAPAGSRETLRQVKAHLGTVPSLAAAMAEAPTLVRAFFAVREIYSQGSLTPGEIHVLSLANAFDNDCHWCMAFHSFAALREGVPAEAVDALRAGQEPKDRRLAALSRLSRTLVRNRGRVTRKDLEAFQAAGLSPAQALEVVLGIGFSVMANFAGHLARPPLDPPFQPHEWSHPAPGQGEPAMP